MNLVKTILPKVLRYELVGTTKAVFLGLLTGCMCLTTALVLTSTTSSFAKTSGTIDDASAYWDPITLPITDAALHSALITDSGNAAMEYQYLMRAGYQHHEQVAYDTMNQLRQDQPNNAVVLAGYFLAFRMMEGGTNTMYYNGGRQLMPMDPQRDQEAQAVLQQAYHLDPKLWMIYAVDGEDRYYDPTGDRQQGLALLQKAERLGPNVSYVHKLLGRVYANPPLTEMSYQAAVHECEQVFATGSRDSDAAFILFQIYQSWRPDHALALKWKHKYLSLVPPDVKINPFARQELDQCPG